jgi:hypothetical protein
VEQAASILVQFLNSFQRESDCLHGLNVSMREILRLVHLDGFKPSSYDAALSVPPLTDVRACAPSLLLLALRFLLYWFGICNFALGVS